LGFIVRSIIILMVSSNLVMAHRGRSPKRKVRARTLKALSRRVAELKASLKMSAALIELSQNRSAALTRRVVSLEASLNKSDDLTRRVAKLEASGANIKIVSSQGKAGNAECAKVCAGTTKRGATAWKDYSSTGVYVEVDMSKCGFATVPTITTSVEGRSNHWIAAGTSSVYAARKDGFIIYLKQSVGLKGGANKWKWNVEWVAVGYTC
jgi:hypothetical protein